MPDTVKKAALRIVETPRGAVEPAVVRIAIPERAETPPAERYIMTLPRKVVRVLADSAVVGWAVLVSAWLLGVRAETALMATGVLLLTYPLAFYLSGMYEIDVRVSGRRTLQRLVMASVLVAGIAAPLAYLLDSLRLPHALLLSVLAMVMLVHPVCNKVLNWVMHVSLPPLRVAIVGSGEAAEALVRVMKGSRAHEVVAVCADGGSTLRRIVASRRSGGDALRDGVEQIIVAVTGPLSQATLDVLLEARTHGVPVTDIIPPYEALTGRVPVNHLTKEWVAFASGFLPHRRFEAKVKRLVDIGASLALLLLFLPIGLVVALLVRLDSPGPVFHRQKRVGANSRVFEIVKFRTMRADAERGTGAVWAARNDTRITRLGKWLRLSRLDEFPQLVNVLRGEMSLVGPRPERPEFVRLLAERVPYYELRHLVKPGITGWAQVCYPYGASVEDARVKLEYDLYYIRHRTPLFDLRVMAKTLSVLLFAQGSR
jgi:exopolysaccharide biosynthesis polyprenyl glycosylphosphotransferase